MPLKVIEFSRLIRFPGKKARTMLALSAAKIKPEASSKTVHGMPADYFWASILQHACAPKFITELINFL